MVVTVVSMPEGTRTRTDVTEARRLLGEARFLLVDVELAHEGPAAQEEPLARRLGLGEEELAWFGRMDEPVRADFLGDVLGLVVPVVQDERVVHVHALASERFLVAAHRGPAVLAARIGEHLRRERHHDAVAVLFLMLQEALATFRRAAVATLLEVEELEDAMFERRRPEHVYRLVQLRRRAALLHHSLLPTSTWWTRSSPAG